MYTEWANKWVVLDPACTNAEYSSASDALYLVQYGKTTLDIYSAVTL